MCRDVCPAARHFVPWMDPCIFWEYIALENVDAEHSCFHKYPLQVRLNKLISEYPCVSLADGADRYERSTCAYLCVLNPKLSNAKLHLMCAQEAADLISTQIESA